MPHPAAVARFAAPLPSLGLADVDAASAAAIDAADASALLRLMRDGRVSSAEAVSHYARRAREAGRALNFTTQECFADAIAEARRSDARRAAGAAPRPLEGLPVSLKDCFEQRGYDAAVGVAARAGAPLAADGAFVRALRALGAVPLVRTNTPPLMLAAETDNCVYGRTLNPWDPARTPGGSSGGEAACVAAGASPLGFGTDIGGSVRIPAALCGIVGFKPTARRWSTEGIALQEAPGQLVVLSAPGPMARSVDDCALALGAVIGAAAADAAADPHALHVPFSRARYESAAPLRVGWVEAPGGLRPCPTALRAVRDAVRALRGGAAPGVAVAAREFAPPEVGEAMRLQGRALTIGTAAWVRATLAGEEPHPLIAASARGGKRENSAADLLRNNAGIVEYRQRFLAAWRAAGIDVLLCPATPVPAPLHGTSRAYTGAYTGLFNLLGYPAGVLPVARVEPGECGPSAPPPPPPPPSVPNLGPRPEVGAGAAGLPVAVQVVALPFRDEDALRVMRALERRFPCPRTPPAPLPASKM